jgi:anti-sigma factor RsiW
MPDPSVDVVCRQVVELVTDYLEGALPADLRAAVERHLQLCPPCVTYVEQVRQTVAALGHLPGDALPAGAVTQLESAFRDFHDRRH